MQAQGSRGQILIQRESTFKALPGVPEMERVHFISESLRMSRGFEQSETIRSDRNPSRPANGDTEVGGNITLELQAYMGLLLEAAFGEVTTTGTGPYVHTFKIGTDLPSLLIEKGFTDLGHYFRYSGCKVNSLSMDVTRSGFQKVALDFMGAEEAVESASFDTTPTDNTKKSWDGFLVASITEGGVPIANVAEISGLTLENNLDGENYTVGGGGVRRSLPAGSVRVAGTVRAMFEDLSLYNKAIAGTESSLAFTYRFGTGDGSAGNEEIAFNIPELIYSPNAPVIEGPKGIFVELPFEAYYDDGSAGSAMTAVLKNSQAVI